MSTKTLGFIIVAFVVGAGAMHFYEQMLPGSATNISNQALFADKAKCAEDGAAWVKQNPYTPGWQVDNYAYAPDLSTCLIYDTDGYGTQGGDNSMIYDLYAGKILASCDTDTHGAEASPSSCEALASYISRYFSTATSTKQ